MLLVRSERGPNDGEDARLVRGVARGSGFPMSGERVTARVVAETWTRGAAADRPVPRHVDDDDHEVPARRGSGDRGDEGPMSPGVRGP
jgi:hypothetical protein